MDEEEFVTPPHSNVQGGGVLSLLFIPGSLLLDLCPDAGVAASLLMLLAPYYRLLELCARCLQSLLIDAGDDAPPVSFA